MTHAIHVLGPNMNPQRPDCLKHDYINGCKVLRNAYASLFEKFASIARGQRCNKERDDDSTHESKDRIDIVTWGGNTFHYILVLSRSPGLGLLAAVLKEHLPLLKAMHSAGFFPLQAWETGQSAHSHVLGQRSIPGYFLRRQKPLHMNFCWVLKWAEKFLREYASLIFRFGYHSVPSIRQLHLHVVSQDCGSPHLKNKKRWNSFKTFFFFCDSTDVIEEVEEYGEATLNKDEKLLSMELRCRRCKSMHPNILRLKFHIANCKTPFSSNI